LDPRSGDCVDQEEDLRRIIRDAGFQPAQRDAAYRMMFLN
jgi:cyclic dehypoxanthinyl futalosine synthase